MDCREFLLRYSDYDDSLIPPQEAGRFRAHMAACASCARYDRVLRKGRMLARQKPTVEPSLDFMPRLQRRILATRRGRDRWRWSARLGAGLAAATILMVATTALDLMAGGDRTGEGAGRAAVQAAARPGPPVVATAATPARGAARLMTVPRLPAGEPGTSRGWSAEEVASEGAASYSPLVTGPPAYRVRRPSRQRTYDPDRRALD